MYILMRTDQGGGYVNQPGSKKAYNTNPLAAKRYQDQESAVRDSCPGNEVPVDLNHIIDNYGRTEHA